MLKGFHGEPRCGGKSNELFTFSGNLIEYPKEFNPGIQKSEKNNTNIVNNSKFELTKNSNR